MIKRQIKKYFKKQHLRILTAILAFALIYSGYAAHAAASSIIIDKTAAEIPSEMGQIRERDNRTFVPVRFISEFLKYEVWFDTNSRAACISSAASLIYIQNGSTSMFITSLETGESTAVAMDTAAYIDSSDNRTYLPIRFLAEALGYEVGWDEASQTVTLDKL